MGAAWLAAAPVATVVAVPAVRRGRVPASSTVSASEGASGRTSVAVQGTCNAALVVLGDCSGWIARLTPFPLSLGTRHPADLAGRRQFLQQVQRHLCINVSVRVEWIRSSPAGPESLFHSLLPTASSAYELNAVQDDCGAELLSKWKFELC